MHDELRPRRNPEDSVSFRLPLGTPEEIYRRLNDLFKEAKSRPHWGNIFDPGEEIKLTGDALRLCVARLEPHSLTQTDLEVIDAAFEYLINPEQKGQKGQYFTPRPVVKMAVRIINPKDGELVIDPACGSCGFLIHTIKHVQSKYGWEDDKIYRYANESLFAIDFDERLKKVAKTMMIIAGDGKANVYSVNSLDIRDWQNSEIVNSIGEFNKDSEHGQFDIVLTNPPFAGKITGKTQLSAYTLYDMALRGELGASDDQGDEIESQNTKRRQVSGMNRDILFLERCLKLLKPGGRMGIVLPQGNFNNVSLQGLRDWLITKGRILAVVSLHENTFKKFTNTKTSVLFLQKWDEKVNPYRDEYEIFMATSQKSGKNNSGNYIYRTDEEGNLVDTEGITITESNRAPAIDHDLGEIANEFIEWGRKEGFRYLNE